MINDYTMIKVAITGSIASGKSQAESSLQKQGIVTLDTDKIVHDLLENDEKIINRVYGLFARAGVDVRKESGSIDRQKVAGIVFSDKQKLKALEKIIHPKVRKITEEFFNNNRDKKLIAVSVPMLYESNMDILFDFVILITADENTRIERLAKSRNLTEEQAKNRINSQDFGPEKIAKADFTIENNGSVEELEMKVKKVLEKIKNHQEIR